MYKLVVFSAFLAVLVACAPPAEPPEETAPMEEFLGRWDVTVSTEDGRYPSWWEFAQEGGRLTGSFVGRVGSARPIPNLEVSGTKFKFSLPTQYEAHKTDMMFEGELGGGRLQGTTNAENGSTLEWVAVRAPELPVPEAPEWEEPIELFNGKDLTGWKARDPEVPNQWKARRGVLANTDQGTDLMTEDSFRDFKLHLEFQYPEHSNSGIYLRGRYEVQVQDDFGKEPSSVYMGGVYGFLTPTKNNAKKAGEWQSYDITLLGRRITVVLNGETVINNQEIPGITGGALESNEGEPGPIMIQGDHGPVSYRNIVLTPVK